MDCIGVLVCAAYDAGAKLADFCCYSRFPNGLLIPHLKEQLVEIPLGQVDLADVLAFWIADPNNYQHLAIVSCVDRWRMIHAVSVPNNAPASKVREDKITRYWRERIYPAAFRFREAT